MRPRAFILTLLSMGAGLLLAASAWASTGAVLNSAGHELELVSGDRVQAYRDPVAASLPLGSRVRFSASGTRIRELKRAGGRVRKLSFGATVAGYAHFRLVLRLTDHRLLRFGAGRLEQLCSTGPPPLSTGERLRVVELLSRGGYRLALRTSKGHSVCPDAAGSLAGVGGDSAPVQEATGTVTEVDHSDVVVQEPTGASLTLNAPADAIDFLSNAGDISLAPCETVAVSYQQGSSGLDLDSLAITGQSLLGCVEDDGVSLLVVGTLESVGSSSFGVYVPGAGSLVLGQDPNNPVTDGFEVGDHLLVTYSVNPDGSLLGTDASDDIVYTTGTVASVNDNALTIADWTTHTTETFVADEATFTSIKPGDAVGVAYYQNAAGLQGENVDDLTNGTSG